MEGLGAGEVCTVSVTLVRRRSSARGRTVCRYVRQTVCPGRLSPRLDHFSLVVTLVVGQSKVSLRRALFHRLALLGRLLVSECPDVLRALCLVHPSGSERSQLLLWLSRHTDTLCSKCLHWLSPVGDPCLCVLSLCDGWLSEALGELLLNEGGRLPNTIVHLLCLTAAVPPADLPHSSGRVELYFGERYKHTIAGVTDKVAYPMDGTVVLSFRLIQLYPAPQTLCKLWYTKVPQDTTLFLLILRRVEQDSLAIVGGGGGALVGDRLLRVTAVGGQLISIELWCWLLVDGRKQSSLSAV